VTPSNRTSNGTAIGHGSVDGPDDSWRFGLVQFTRSAGILSVSSIAGLVRAVVSAKILAVALGPEQVGVLSQLLNFSALLLTILPLGLTTGVAKMIAEASRDNVRVNVIVGSSTLIAVASGLVGAALIAPIAPEISAYLTGSERYAFALLLVVASFPLSTASGVLSYVLQGLADVRRLTVANVATALLTLVFLVPATLLYGLNGAAASVLVGGVLQAVIFTAALWRAYGTRQWRIRGQLLSAVTSRELLGYGAVMLVGGIGIYASVLAVRTLAVHQLGAAANGLYQVVYGLSNQYITVFMTWMGAYVFPRIAAETDNQRLRSLINSALRANLFLMVPAMVAIISLRVVLVHIFYSSSFIKAADYVPVQAFGDYARVLGWSFGVSLFAQGYKGGHLVAVLAQATAWVVLTGLTLPWLGLSALSFGYALSYVTWPVLMYGMASRWLDYRVDFDQAISAALGLACLLAAALIPQPLGLLVAPVVPLLVYLRRGGSITALLGSTMTVLRR